MFLHKVWFKSQQQAYITVSPALNLTFTQTWTHFLLQYKYIYKVFLYASEVPSLGINQVGKLFRNTDTYMFTQPLNLINQHVGVYLSRESIENMYY